MGSILDEEELKYNVTKAHRIANVTAWKAQVKVFEAAEKAWRKAYGEYHGAEMALSQETTNHAEKKLMEDWEKKKDKAILEEEEQKEIYKAIYDMYWFEHT